MTDTSEGSIAIIPATTFGVVPATPAWQTLRITSESLNGAFETFISNEIRPDAVVSEIRRTGQSGSGDINFELHRNANLEMVLAAGIRGAWTADVCKGSTLKPHFSFERKIEAGATDYYMRFHGARIGGFSLSIAPEEAITGTARVMAVAHEAAPAIITGATYPAVVGVNGPPLVGVDVSALAVGGLAGIDFLGVTIEVELNLRMQRKIGSKTARGIGYGRRVTTGTLRVYFEDLTAYNLLMSDAAAGILATATDGANGYSFIIPRIKFTGGEVPNPGNDQDFVLTLNWQATFDPVLGTDIQIARTGA